MLDIQPKLSFESDFAQVMGRGRKAPQARVPLRQFSVTLSVPQNQMRFASCNEELSLQFYNSAYKKGCIATSIASTFQA
jgi:hypothetical protein